MQQMLLLQHPSAPQHPPCITQPRLHTCTPSNRTSSQRTQHMSWPCPAVSATLQRTPTATAVVSRRHPITTCCLLTAHEPASQAAAAATACTARRMHALPDTRIAAGCQPVPDHTQGPGPSQPIGEARRMSSAGCATSGKVTRGGGDAERCLQLQTQLPSAPASAYYSAPGAPEEGKLTRVATHRLRERCQTRATTGSCRVVLASPCSARASARWSKVQPTRDVHTRPPSQRPCTQQAAAQLPGSVD